ncbi:bifunctional 3,4-dihydroxy-2-butanone 4-phosphate synthase/GTP cyclohydrolase II [Hydrogenimonas urashimensis]|uniref:bifunctional 3,4-dihydroxy-2-butanone 4-phosphate synthase/GTP cyclohydrolase II n=1 Tax=Hydrogenimonas urashimensis TaxID=2740515 RepID=UPI0019156AD3|nr:bifunctional 3,4-dihydroxy-2-butanone 4-phosphate synthase/GTP cyclohydrolase II [Hydrogenimonas urashimensis]
MPIKRVQQAIEDIKHGKMVVMIDDEDRENEGDLVYAATFSTPEHVNFMATEAKGLICVAISREIAERLDLRPMVQHNDSQHETAFTVSVDAREATTGISAYERDMTIRLLASPISSPEDLVRPGHIFPLIAKEGGVLVRTGHTEGSVDLCRLAGLAPSAVICEIMREDGQMARRDDLEIFAKEHGLNIVYISDLVEYRLRNERLVRLKEEETIKFFDTNVEKKVFTDHEGKEHTAIVFYKLHEAENVKFHNIGRDVDLFLNQQKYRQLIKSIDYLKRNGGTIIFVDTDDTVASDTMKEYGIGAQILAELGIKNIRLLVSSKGREFVGLGGFGLDIVEEIEL